MNTTSTTTSPQCIVVENFSHDNIFRGSRAECEAWLDNYCKGYERPEKVRSRFFIYEVKKS